MSETLTYQTLFSAIFGLEKTVARTSKLKIDNGELRKSRKVKGVR
jgi:hypothetical protein